jgi:excinuclease ABC subunit C
MRSLALALPATDLEALRFRVRKLADDRPGTYRMVDAAGRVLYVGKAKALRTRLLSYFRASFPEDKAARILHAASNIEISPAPSEFAAALQELELIRKHRPPYNVAMNRNRKHGFLVVTDDRAPRLVATANPDRLKGRIYGPFPSRGATHRAARVLMDLLGIRDCRADMPIHFAEQQDLFAAPMRAACPRLDFGTCGAPCAAAITETAYRQRADLAAAFCEGRSAAPFDRIISEMGARAAEGDFERATYWREKFEALEWLLAAVARHRSALDALTFVYRDPGARGDARAYLIVRGEIRACYPDPVSPIEREAFAAVVAEELAKPLDPPGRVAPERLHQRMLVMSWFRNRPEAWRRVTAVWGVGCGVWGTRPAAAFGER